jgi:hypothetical protein
MEGMMESEVTARHELHRNLEAVLGEEHAMTLMRNLPSGPAASPADVRDAIGESERRLDAKIDGVEQHLDAKIEHVVQVLDARIDGVEHRVVGAIHAAVAELRKDMANQVRTHTFATIGALLTLAMIAFGAARLV